MEATKEQLLNSIEALDEKALAIQKQLSDLRQEIENIKAIHEKLLK